MAMGDTKDSVDEHSQHREAQHRSDFWMKVAGITFGLWSLAVPFGVVIVRDNIREIIASQERFQHQFNSYVLNMERRITLIEAHHEQTDRRLDNHGTDADSHRNGWKK